MMNECKAVRGLLALRPDEWSTLERHQAEGHLRTCPDCTALAQAYADQDRLIRAAPRVRLTPSQRAQLFSRIQQEKSRDARQLNLSVVMGTAMAVVALVALTLALSALFQGTDRLATNVPASPYRQPEPWIAFTSWRDGNGEIYVMRADGSGQTRLTNNRVRDSDPVWSPAPPEGGTGGTWIAFVSWQDGGNQEIYVTLAPHASAGVRADGSELTNLTNHPATDESPTWSPDGTQIVFTSWRDGNLEIYRVNVDGSGLTNLTNDPAEDSCPAWSPDGTRIAFTSLRDGNPAIYLITAPGLNADDGELIKLPTGPGGGGCPIWSPDGTRIAITSKPEGDDVEIYVVNVQEAIQGGGSSEPIRLTNNSAADIPFAWSSDSTRIVFESDRDGNWEIYVIRADGSGLTRLTNQPAEDREPAWSPDGMRIAFASNRNGGRDGNWEIYVVNVDGSGLTNLTNHPANDAAPAWRP